MPRKHPSQEMENWEKVALKLKMRGPGLGGAAAVGLWSPALRPLSANCKWPAARPLNDSHDCLQKVSCCRPMAATSNLCALTRLSTFQPVMMAWAE
jgi:hypothetical protein